MHPARLRVLVVALLLAIDLVVEAYHGAAHSEVPMGIGVARTWIVALSGMILPFVALALMWRRRAQAGAVVLGVSMVTALGYGVLSHFQPGNPESVADVPEDAPWSTAYRLTATLLTVTQSLTLAAAAWVLRGASDANGVMSRAARRRGR